MNLLYNEKELNNLVSDIEKKVFVTFVTKINKLFVPELYEENLDEFSVFGATIYNKILIDEKAIINESIRIKKIFNIIDSLELIITYQTIETIIHELFHTAQDIEDYYNIKDNNICFIPKEELSNICKTKSYIYDNISFIENLLNITLNKDFVYGGLPDINIEKIKYYADKYKYLSSIDDFYKKWVYINIMGNNNSILFGESTIDIYNRYNPETCIKKGLSIFNYKNIALLFSNNQMKNRIFIKINGQYCTDNITFNYFNDILFYNLHLKNMCFKIYEENNICMLEIL